MAGPPGGAPNTFRARLAAGRLPRTASPLGPDDAGLTRTDLAQLFESQLASRHLDLAARRFGAQGRAFYSIGSAGHEGNAAVARALRLTDIAFLHYRSGAFFLERARQDPGSSPLWDMALSFTASAEDPCSGGRHKVIGAKALNIPPQTSTIASHLPKAVGAAFGASLNRTLGRDTPDTRDGVVLCSFGDASANHSTAQGAFNTAAWLAYQNRPLPLIFLCEDNGIGISVPTPKGWIAANFAHRPGLDYVAGDGRDPVDAFAAARRAADRARAAKRPVFLHLRMARLMGHAGSDVESVYRDRAAIEADADHDPLLFTARRLIDAGAADRDAILALDAEAEARAERIMGAAAARPKLETVEAVAASLVPAPRPPPLKRRADPAPPPGPLHMSRMIAHALGEILAQDPGAIVFGEDVGAKGGVYGATSGLQKRFGPARVFDTPLDEQSILGGAVGMAHQDLLPIAEIQFLAYVHNAEDQLRGEAATLPFFSSGAYANPMIVRVAGLGYQKGFGGHFHNDNALGVFRDVPGLILACPSNAYDAALMHLEAWRLARAEGRVIVMLEPIALYGVKDLHDPGDGLMTAAPPPEDAVVPLGRPGVHGDGRDVAILTYGNGAFLARRAAKRLDVDHGIQARVVDLRWLNPLPVDAARDAAGDAAALLIVDECRRTGSVSEELTTRLIEAGETRPLARLTGDDVFVPLGPAATLGMPSEAGIIAAARALLGETAAKPIETVR